MKKSRFARQAVAEAARVQSRLTGGEIMCSHMMTQEHFGWNVHTYHGEKDDKPEPVGRIADLDRLTMSPRGTNRMRMRRRAEEALADAKRAHARKMTAMRDAIRAASAGEYDTD